MTAPATLVVCPTCAATIDLRPLSVAEAEVVREMVGGGCHDCRPLVPVEGRA